MSDSKKAVAAAEKLGRYNTVVLAKDWMEVVKDTEEYRGVGQSELVKMAVDEIRSGNITQEVVDKLQAAKKKAAAAGEAEEKKPEKTEKGEK